MIRAFCVFLSLVLSVSSLDRSVNVSPLSRKPIIAISAYEPGQEPTTVVYYTDDLPSEEALEAESRKLLYRRRRSRQVLRRRRRRSPARRPIARRQPVRRPQSNGGGSSGCGQPAQINDIRRGAGRGSIGWAGDLQSLSTQLNNACGYSHSCAKTAEILYWEKGHPERCHNARACQAWKRSPGHYNIVVGSYNKYGCASKVQGDGSRIRRCCFRR